jgi:hypothetical protein
MISFQVSEFCEVWRSAGVEETFPDPDRLHWNSALSRAYRIELSWTASEAVPAQRRDLLIPFDLLSFNDHIRSRMIM